MVRPDSGDPAAVVLRCLQILEEHFGSTINEKGFKVLNNVRVLQGDGITLESIGLILDTAIAKGFSADNLVFGQGGALLQIVNRDDQKFAMKCSAAKVNGEWVDVFKDPITDKGKQSKKGILALIPQPGPMPFVTIREEHDLFDMNALQDVFVNGIIHNEQTLDGIRMRAAL